MLFAILLRILTTWSEMYIDITPLAYIPRNSRSSGHRCTLNEHWEFSDLYHSYTIASCSAWNTFNILLCSCYIPCIYTYIDVYLYIHSIYYTNTSICIVYTYISLIYTGIYAGFPAARLDAQMEEAPEGTQPSSDPSQKGKWNFEKAHSILHKVREIILWGNSDNCLCQSPEVCMCTWYIPIYTM